MALAIDVNVSTDKNTQSTGTVTATTPSFTTTTATELLVLFIEATLNATTSDTHLPSISSVSGAGLTWTQVAVESSANTHSLVAVYKAFATSILTSQTVSAAIANPISNMDVSITLLSFTGADQTNGIGATASISNTTGGTFSASLNTTAANSWVWGCGADYNSNATRTAGTSQAIAHFDNDSTDGTALWVQKQTSTTSASGTNVTINDTAPTNWLGDGLAVEILAAAAGGNNYTQNVSDSFTLAESFTWSLSRVIADSFTITDGITKAPAKLLGPDSFSPSDSLARMPGKLVSDTLTLADSIIRSTGKLLADTYTIAENIAKKTARSLADTFSLSDVYSAIKTKVIAFTDAFSLSDALAKLTGKSVSDSINQSDSIAKQPSKSLKDTFSLSDVFSAIKTKILLLADTFSVSDTLARFTGKSLNESITQSDNVAKSTTKSAFRDTFTLSDVFSALKTKVLQLVDAFSLNDSVSRFVKKGFAETFSLSETFAAGRQKFLQLLDSISLSDSLKRMPGKAFAEAVTISESIARSISKGFTEAFSLIDSIAKVLTGAADAVRVYFAQLFQRLWPAQFVSRTLAAQPVTRLWSATEQMIYSAPKDAEATEDFEIDWTAVVGADTIASSTWEVPTGLTLVQSSNTTTTATARLSGGTAGESYVVKNKVTLASGQIKPQSLLLPIV